MRESAQGRGQIADMTAAGNNTIRTIPEFFSNEIKLELDSNYMHVMFHSIITNMFPGGIMKSFLLTFW